MKPEQLMMKLLEDEVDLCDAYHRALTVEDDNTTDFTIYQKLIRIIRQTFGYMVVNDLQYGLLTSYVQTWFLYRQSKNPSILYISPAVPINQNHTPTQASF